MDQSSVFIPGGFDLKAWLLFEERRFILAALEAAKGSKARAGDLLRMKRTTLVARMKSLGIPLNNEEVPSEL